MMFAVQCPWCKRWTAMPAHKAWEKHHKGMRMCDECWNNPITETDKDIITLMKRAREVFR